MLEIPKLNAHDKIEIPMGAVPFFHRRNNIDERQMLIFYEKDPVFRDFVSVPQNYINEIKNFKFVSTPDCSLYMDMPLVFQLANIGVSRIIGYYLQEQGKYIIPSVRWGDERTYKYNLFKIPPAFAGIPKNDIVSIGTYGCCQSSSERYYLKNGLEAMISYLEPKAVIVYERMNPNLFNEFSEITDFYNIPDWITQKKGGKR